MIETIVLTANPQREEEIHILLKNFAMRIQGTGHTAEQVLPLTDRITALAAELKAMRSK